VILRHLLEARAPASIGKSRADVGDDGFRRERVSVGTAEEALHRVRDTDILSRRRAVEARRASAADPMKLLV
jgi:hypothetical protein